MYFVCKSDDPNGNIKFTVIFPGDEIPDTIQPSSQPTVQVADSEKAVQKSLLSTFSGSTGSTGIMFDVVAINSIDITALDLHLRSDKDEGKQLIEIYVMSGTHVGNENKSESWSKVCCSKKVVSLPRTAEMLF